MRLVCPLGFSLEKYLGTGFIAHFEKRDILGWVAVQRTVAKKEKTIACARYQTFSNVNHEGTFTLRVTTIDKVSNQALGNKY